ncbi:MAG TPA: phosphatase PAP2 family protein [Polyangiaceae bacterium]|nr:phosphatase PAP2 family protein [Polyangiaceae bacterium]
MSKTALPGAHSDRGSASSDGNLFPLNSNLSLKTLPRRLCQRMWSLWGPALVLPFIPALYALVPAWRGDLRPEHVALGLVVPIVAFWGPRAKQFLCDVSPYIAVAVGYDLVRYVRPLFVTEHRVLGQSLRNAELALFGVGPNTTLQDYFNAHNAPAFDLLFAVPYAIFVYVAALYAIYLYFVDRPRMRHYLLSFAIANYLAFACWLIFPAAPPWYLRRYGAHIDIAALPSPAALVRVDALLGVHYFRDFYARASSVFGALPSMHCAYPAIGLLTAYRAGTWRTRSIHLIYSLTMVVAAVYLDHHWVIDCIAGLVMATVSVRLAGYWLKRREAAWTSAAVPLPAASSALQTQKL